MNTKTIKNSQKIPSKKKDVSKSRFLVMNRESLSKSYYQDIIAYDLILKQNYTSIMQLPRLEKLILNTTSKIYINDKKSLLFTIAALDMISGQKVQLTHARKSIANFKLREGQLLGCKVVLRETQMYTFLDKLSKIVFPRIRDHAKTDLTKNNEFVLEETQTHGVKSPLNRKFSQKFSSSSFGFQNLMIFPELENHYLMVEQFRGMTLTCVLSHSTPQTSSLVLSGFQLPFFF